MADPFSAVPRDKWIFETEYFFAIADKFPVSEGHLLIVSAEEATDYRDLSLEAKSDLTRAIDLAIEHISHNHNTDGFNIGMNCGAPAGQTVFRFHCHVIPRRKGDVPDPRGGVRHAVMGKGYY